MSSPTFPSSADEPEEDPGSPLIVQQLNDVPRSTSSPFSSGAGIGIGAVEEDREPDDRADSGRPLPPRLPVSEIPLWMTQSMDTECGTGRSANGTGNRDLAVTDSFEATTVDPQQTKDSALDHTPALSWLAKPEAISRRRRNSASVSDGAPLLPPPPLPNGRLSAYNSGFLSPPTANPLTQAMSNVLHYFSLVRILTDGLAVFDSQTGRPCTEDDIEDQLAHWGATALRALPNLIRGIEWKSPEAGGPGKQTEDVGSTREADKEKPNEKEKGKGSVPPLSSSEPSYGDSLRQSSSVKSGKGFKAGVAKRSNLRSSNLVEETSTDTLLASASIKYSVPTETLKTTEEVPQPPPWNPNPMLAGACENAVGLFVELLREGIVVLIQAPHADPPTSASASPEAGKDSRRKGDIGKTTAALAQLLESYEGFTAALATQRSASTPDSNAQSNAVEDFVAATEKLLQCIVATTEVRESAEAEKPSRSLLMRFTTRSAGMNALVIPVTPPKAAAAKQETDKTEGIAVGRVSFRLRQWHQFLFPHRIATWNTIVVVLMVLGCVRDTEDPMFIPCLVIGLVGVIVAFALSLSNVVEAKEESRAEKERSLVSMKLTQVLSCCTQLPPVRLDRLDSRRSTLEGPPLGVGFVFGAVYKEDAFSPNGGGFLQASHSPQQSIQVTAIAPGLENTPTNVSSSLELRQSQQGLAAKRDKQSIPSPLMLSNFVVEASASSMAGLDLASSRADLRPQNAAETAGHTVTVEIDPTGTFLVPFLEETDPILIDGQHIHSHLAMVGLEMSTDPSEVEDPYKVCLWNHAMVEATGGYSAQTALQLSLGQILADKQSLTTCQSIIDRMKVSISLTGGSPPTERFVIRVVHREQGFCRMQMTVAPVTQLNALSGRPEMIGAVFMGIPLDPRTALSSYGFRTLYLAEVFEQFYLEVKQAKPFSASSPEASVRSPTSPAGSTLSRALNEGSMGELLRFLSSLETIDDEGWESLYASSAKHLVAHAMAPQKCRVEIDDSIPAVITCDVSGISALLKLILQITGVSDFSTPTPSVSSTVPVVLTLSAPTLESAALLINVAGLPLTQLKAALDQLAHSVGVGSPNRRRELGLVLNLKELMQSLNAFILFCDTPSPAAGTGTGGNHLHRQISMMSDSTNTGSGATSSESLFVFVPFKPTSGIQTNWLRPGGLAPNVTPTMSPGGSFRHGSLARIHSPSEFAVSVMVAERHEIDRQKLIRALWDESHSVCALEDGLLLVEGAPILRSGLRKIEAVVFRCIDVLGTPYPDGVETDRVADNGVLGSDPLADWNAQLLQMVSEFSEVQFLCLVPRRKDKEKLIRVESTGAAMGGLGSASDLQQNRQWYKMPNVHFVEVTKSSFADEVLQTLTKVVRASRKEKERRDELEKLLKEHRGSTWVKGKKLGSGAFGDVFEAEMTMTGGKMAVKMIRVPKDDKRGIESVMNEVSVMCTLSHPNIVRYFYCELTGDGDQVNLFMELCKGGSLASLLTDRKRTLHPLTEQEVSTYAFQMLSAMAYIHSLGYAHRDIKPANILFNEGQLKLTDFGTARVLANQKVKETAGTFQYMAPEIVSGREHTMSCDIWSIGCVALEMLGALPQAARFQGSFGSCNSDGDVASAIVAELAKQKRQISKDAFSFILSCLHLTADLRPTADALLTHDFILSVQRGAGAGLLRRSSTISILSTTKATQRPLSVGSSGPVPQLPSGQSSAKKPTTVILTGDLSICSDGDGPGALSQRALSICSDDEEEGTAVDDEPAVRTENSDVLNRTPPTSFPLPPKGPPSRLAKHRPEALNELTGFEEQRNVWKSTNPSVAPTPSSTRNQFPRGTLISPAAVSRKAQSSSDSQGLREGHSTSTAVILATPSTTMSAGAEK